MDSWCNQDWLASAVDTLLAPAVDGTVAYSGRGSEHGDADSLLISMANAGSEPVSNEVRSCQCEKRLHDENLAASNNENVLR